MTAQSLPFSISLDLALDGPGAADRASFDTALNDAEHALTGLREAYAKNTLELLRIAERRDDLQAAAPIAAKLRENTSEICVFGIGGSSLGGQALADLLPFGAARAPRVRFFDNPDPFTTARALESFDLKKARFVCISKSGGTAETLMQTLAAADAIEKAGGGKYLKQHFVVITEPKPSPLRQFAESIGCPVLDHPLGIGGRYSVLSLVGMLPAMLMDLDVEAIRSGANSVVQQMLNAKQARDVPAAAGAALHHALARSGHLRETVLWSYADALKTFGPWWRQLWAESLGKDRQGSTPVSALGPVDQHSQLQLFLGGPGEALFSLVSTGMAGEGPVISRARTDALGLAYLNDKSIGDLVSAEVRATAETLHARGRPVRRIHVPKIDERSLGALMMHFMLETIIMGRLMRVDPFDQPAVEEGKVLARRYLQSGRE
jgi:glucose-6-phosphate isomerase